ncbi:unnamed protein product [Rhizophagus irregularis]|nr:unnamed protein product [Rhizophagus irregularis]
MSEASTPVQVPPQLETSHSHLKEVLAKYGIDGNGIGAIRQFPPKTYTLEDNDEELIQCIKEIKRRE